MRVNGVTVYQCLCYVCSILFLLVSFYFFAHGFCLSTILVSCILILFCFSCCSDHETFKGLEEKQLCAADERITDEEFKAWSEQFKKEMVAKGIWERKATDTSRLTGRQMFESDQALVKTALDNEAGITDIIDDGKQKQKQQILIMGNQS